MGLYKFQILQTTPKEEQKTIIRKLKEEQRRKMALLGEQYEQTIADMLQKQSVNIYWQSSVTLKSVVTLPQIFIYAVKLPHISFSLLYSSTKTRIFPLNKLRPKPMTQHTLTLPLFLKKWEKS